MTEVTWLTKKEEKNTTLIDRFCVLKITTSFTGLNHLVPRYFFLWIRFQYIDKPLSYFFRLIR